MAPGTFADRRDAGRALAAALRGAAVDLVLGLPRGGVVVAADVAAALHAPLDVALVRKVGAPGHAEWGVGAIGEDEVAHFDQAALDFLRVTPADLAGTVRAEVAELRRRRRQYRGSRPAPALAGRRVLIVDDGLATGVTARAALRWARAQRPRWLGFATPVSLADTDRTVGDLADAVWCVRLARHLSAVGGAYRDFSPVTDAEVVQALAAPTA